MKRTISKIFCVIMALCVFLGAMPVMSFAQDEPDGYVVVDPIDAISFSPEVQLEIPEGATDEFEANKFYGATSDADTPYLFYSQLSDNQKIIYDLIYSAGVTETIALPFDYPSAHYTGSGATYEEALENVKAILTNDVAAAITAVAEDNPLIFWINGFGYGFSYYKTQIDSVCYVYTCDVTLTIRLDTNSYANFTVVQNCYDQLVEAVNDFKVNGINRFEKVKSINDTLCDMVTYPEQQGTFSDGSPWYGPMAHQPTGALLNGSAVCEGYAEAFKLICDREGIPCITVLGTGNGGAHKWNYVKMDDNKWYMMDVTWNDQVSHTYYNWFNTGSTFDGGDHVNGGQMYSGTDFVLQYPTLEAENYMLGVLMVDAPDLAFSNTKNVLYVGKGQTDYLDYVGMQDGISGTINSYDVTGTRLSLTNDNTSVTKAYTVAMRGDINSSDTVTADDYNLVVATAKAQNNVTENTGNFYAGDMTQDGAIDGFDAITLDLYLDGTIDFN